MLRCRTLLASIALLGVTGLCASCASSDDYNGRGAAGSGAERDGMKSGGGGGGAGGGRTPAVPRVSTPLLVDATPRGYPGVHNAVAFHEET